MYHIHSGTSQSYTSSMLPGLEDSNHPSERTSPIYIKYRLVGDIAVIFTNLKFRNRAFLVLGPREWNSLPASVCQCNRNETFI